MAKIDLARRAEIGREKRARTRAQIVEAGLVLLAERPPEALTVDTIVEAAGGQRDVLLSFPEHR
jgi:AcrR family transcriptional regulator